jgi:hypothetical protein
MNYLVRKTDDGEIHCWWCYYNNCDDCPDRFRCFTENIIIRDCIFLKESDIIGRLRTHGIDVKKLAEF